MRVSFCVLCEDLSLVCSNLLDKKGKSYEGREHVKKKIKIKLVETKWRTWWSCIWCIPRITVKEGFMHTYLRRTYAKEDTAKQELPLVDIQLSGGQGVVVGTSNIDIQRQLHSTNLCAYCLEFCFLFFCYASLSITDFARRHYGCVFWRLRQATSDTDESSGKNKCNLNLINNRVDSAAADRTNWFY